MRYDQEKLNELAEKIDIVELIGQTEELHRKGQNYFCCCPFHKNDDTPSLCIYPETTNGIASDAVPGVLFMIGFARSIILALSRALIESKI